MMWRQWTKYRPHHRSGMLHIPDGKIHTLRHKASIKTAQHSALAQYVLSWDKVFMTIKVLSPNDNLFWITLQKSKHQSKCLWKTDMTNMIPPKIIFLLGFPFKWWDNIPWWISSIQEFASVTGSYRLTGFLSVLCRCCPTWSVHRHSCVSDAGATEDLLEETKPGWGFILSLLSLTPQSLIENLVCKFPNFTVAYCSLCWYQVSVLYWGSV